ncbi:MAG: glycoside hydrolase family 65 [Acidobacteria bacterium]|nr:glycoside hydrolase family 65 [Acidobacteriota bacterium]
MDRFALVARHNPVLRKFEPLSPLSVGNGEFAFTCDVTGLQTFPELYENAMPLCTMSQWGWHSKPMPESLKDKEFQWTDYDTFGRRVPYQTGRTGQQELYDYLRENPHRLHLGRIGLKLVKADGTEAEPEDVTGIEQKLDLWTGVIESRFKFEGKDVLVRTAAHPTLDALAVSIESPLVGEGKLAVRFAFPYGSPSMQAADWEQPDKHESKFVARLGERAEIERTLDADSYFMAVEWPAGARLDPEKPHHFVLKSSGAGKYEFVAAFSPNRPLANLPNAAAAFAAAADYRQRFWARGAAVEISETADKRAFELERRIVLSQYLTAINCAGSLPPQETGLTTNSWYGKFHLEMHWWHAAHFALWNRVEMLEKSLDYYNRILPSAREKAKKQGYEGVRWPKMTDASGRDSPSPIGPLLIWQQPHPIFYAELVYLNRPTRATLLKFKQIVEETAAFMASFAHLDERTNRFVLGPPVIPAQENHPARETWNPTFELEYWRWALDKANAWRARLKLKRNAQWDDVVARLAPLPVKDGVYLAHENCPQTFTERNSDHPSMLAAYGVLPGEKVDRETMRRTLQKVMKEWKWDDTWGWDYPMTAMTAARLGEPATAIDALLLDTPKNHYAANGHNYQRPNLPLYLPGNGGLLYAIALMAAGWKDAPNGNAPGFPKDWKVRAEGFDAAIFNRL